jgi:hypothetical protein
MASTTRRSRQARNATLAAVVVLMVGGGVLLARWGLGGVQRVWTPAPSCEAVANGVTFSVDPEQMANVATISGIAMRRRLPARAATIALATARQESKFRNLSYGDRDSQGLFQQRPSQGWGTVAQIRDPVYATNAFYDVLVKVDGYQGLEITDVAQRVQRSAYPQAYADHEPEGRVYASALSGNSAAALTCRLDPDDRPAGAAGVTPFRSALGLEQISVPVDRLDGVAGVRLGVQGNRATWSLAHWSVGSAQRLGVARVYADGKVWSRARPDAGWAPSKAGGTGVVVMFSDVTPPTT